MTDFADAFMRLYQLRRPGIDSSLGRAFELELYRAVFMCCLERAVAVRAWPVPPWSLRWGQPRSAADFRGSPVRLDWMRSRLRFRVQYRKQCAVRFMPHNCTCWGVADKLPTLLSMAVVRRLVAVHGFSGSQLAMSIRLQIAHTLTGPIDLTMLRTLPPSAQLDRLQDVAARALRRSPR